MKRIIDFIGSLLGIIFLSPFFIIVALVIKLEEPKGSIFFNQERVGKDGKVFRIYKFRSMITDAEQQLGELLAMNEISGAMFKMRDDPRVTKIGKFIRKTSIDELPQLVNVLKGDMSLVGPRPPLPREVSQYSKIDLHRLLVVPGCTGLWQISGRSNVSFREMVMMDIEYINTRSLWLDMKIIFKTFKLLIGSKNAY